MGRLFQNLTLLIIGNLLSSLLFSVTALYTSIFIPLLSFITVYFPDTFMGHKHAQDHYVRLSKPGPSDLFLHDRVSVSFF